MEIAKLKTFIQSANINFLFGSGLSRPYLSTLGNIETWLTELTNDISISEELRQVMKASIYKEYFTKVILPNHTITNTDNYNSVIDGYKSFLIVWNEIINKRANRLLTKQANIYTTNIDTLVENASEKVQIEFNDGFKGSINQVFDEGNFQKSYSKTSLHFQNTSEIPVFNLLKMHGSINWSVKKNIVSNDYTLNTVNETNIELQKIDSKYFIDCVKFDNGNEMIKTFSEIQDEATKLIEDNSELNFNELYKNLFRTYDELTIVNPTKQKFVESLIELHFYELMRMYSNSLEKEKSILFVMGFSFADEHIAKITLRAAKTNPTLLIIIFAFDDDQEAKYNEILKPAPNNNIFIITPTNFKKSNEENERGKEEINKIEYFDLATINKVFELINNEIPLNYGR
mgnify:CR=1 FL=1|jgi:hypothetical protein